MRARTFQRWAAAAILGCAISTSTAVVAAAPMTITNQGRLFSVDDKPIPGKMDVVFAIYDAPDVNAFATGWNRNNALVAVSTGLLHSMSPDEAEAVLAHEISHVANGDMVTLALIQGVVNTFVIFFSRIIGHLVDRLVFKTEREYGPAYWVTSMIAQMVLGILASIIVMWFSRQREFRADAGGARLAGKNKMIAALEKLAMNRDQAALPEQMAAFGISGGVRLASLFSTHPSLEQRIAALRAGN